ncbi:hypothetical protein SLEP1_g30413 [Rubroshorea leprosula]|uniref:Uncharacterized protein n=1 Tax=Rubroshorea leprosula TaxID=152421 RepID=A0AAV5K008_9ROSI|nr:hypothetical protein SLEP1_g30413 [Rubroshorea leprosula]
MFSCRNWVTLLDSHMQLQWCVFRLCMVSIGMTRLIRRYNKILCANRELRYQRFFVTLADIISFFMSSRRLFHAVSKVIISCCVGGFILRCSTWKRSRLPIDWDAR